MSSQKAKDNGKKPKHLVILEKALQKSKANEDPRYSAEPSEFYKSRAGKFKIVSEDDEKIDWWPCSDFHDETPRVDYNKVNFVRTRAHLSNDEVYLKYINKKGRTCDIRGVIQNPSGKNNGQIRRGKGLTPNSIASYYRLNYNGERRLAKAELIETPAENRKRKLTKALKDGFMRKQVAGFQTWKIWLAKTLEAEKRLYASLTLQTFWRRILATNEAQAHCRALYFMKMKDKEARLAEIEKQREIQRQKELDAYRRKYGFTRDGILYFDTEEEMEEFYRRREKAILMARTGMYKAALNKLSEGFSMWVYYIHHVLPPLHLDVPSLSNDVGGLANFVRSTLYKHKRENYTIEYGDLSNKLYKIAKDKAVEDQVKRGEDSWTNPWHPGVNIKLPGLPDPGIQMRPNGTLEIRDLERYNSFKKLNSGPTDFSSWLVKGAYIRVLFGAYPQGQARLDAETITSRSSCVASLLVAGVDTFVSFLTKEELKRISKKHNKGWRFDKEVDTVVADIRKELIVGVNACSEAVKFARARAERGRKVGYGAKQQQELDRALANREQDYKKAKGFYDNFSPNVNHLFFPIPPNGVVEDSEMVRILKSLENRLRKKERMYIFSLNGRGRIGVVASLLLARQYGMMPMEALERVQFLHDTQGRYKDMQFGQGYSCPDLINQRNQVIRILQQTEPSYDSVVRRVELQLRSEPRQEYADWQTTLQKRKTGPPIPMETLTHHDHIKIMLAKHKVIREREETESSARRRMTTEERHQRETEQIIKERIEEKSKRESEKSKSESEANESLVKSEKGTKTIVNVSLDGKVKEGEILVQEIIENIIDKVNYIISKEEGRQTE